jgi:hypothetical protein
MLDRLQFLVLYVGSAAMAAFVAACLSSPQTATFRCPTNGANAAEQCDLSAMLAAAVAEAGMMNPENLTPDVPILESVAMAAAH